VSLRTTRTHCERSTFGLYMHIVRYRYFLCCCRFKGSWLVPRTRLYCRFRVFFFSKLPHCVFACTFTHGQNVDVLPGIQNNTRENRRIARPKDSSCGTTRFTKYKIIYAAGRQSDWHVSTHVRFLSVRTHSIIFIRLGFTQVYDN